MEFSLTKIGDVSEYLTVGFVGSMSNYFVNDGIPLLRGQNIKPYKLDFTNLKYIPPEIHLKWKKSSLQAGDVVVVRVGYPGTACVIPDGLGDLNAASLVIIRPDSTKMNPYYLCYVLNSPWGKATIQGMLVGSAQQVFNTNTAAELAVPLPPLHTQQKIASILSVYDDLIENNTRRIRILEEMAQSLYREWFVHFRFPGHEKVKLVDSPLGNVPEGWEMKKVGDVVWINPKTKVPKEGKKPFVPMGCLSNDTMLISEVQYRDGNSGSKFKKEDTLFARITPCLENGKTGFVQFLPSGKDVAFGSTEFIVLRSKTLIPEYVYLMARTKEFRNNAIKSMSGATGRQRVQEACFEKFLIAHPDKDTLSKFAENVSPIFQNIYLLDMKNDDLRRMRNLLLPRLISGEILI